MNSVRTLIATTGAALATVAVGLIAGAGPATAAPACGNSSLDYGVTRPDGFMGHSAFVLEYPQPHLSDLQPVRISRLRCDGVERSRAGARGPYADRFGRRQQGTACR